MTGIVKVAMEVFSNLCGLSGSVATLDGAVGNVTGVCSVSLTIETPLLGAAGIIFFRGFLCCLIVCLCLFVTIEGGVLLEVKSLHSL